MEYGHCVDEIKWPIRSAVIKCQLFESNLDHNGNTNGAHAIENRTMESSMHLKSLLNSFSRSENRLGRISGWMGKCGVVVHQYHIAYHLVARSIFFSTYNIFVPLHSNFEPWRR